MKIIFSFSFNGSQTLHYITTEEKFERLTTCKHKKSLTANMQSKYKKRSVPQSRNFCFESCKKQPNYSFQINNVTPAQ